MLCRRGVRQLSRHVSAQETLSRIQQTVANNTPHLNPITGQPLPVPVREDPAAGGAPRPYGPTAYPSPGQNPMSRYNILKYSISPQHRPTHRFDCHSTSNNTITTLSSLTYDHLAPDTPPRSQVLAGFSGGSVGFKKGQRGQYEAGYQCAIRVFKLLEELNDQRRPSHSLKVDLYFRGFGQGREALKTALMSSEGDIIRDLIKRIIDRTALKIGGTRAKKTRRL